MILRKNARQTVVWHKREIQQSAQETLTQLLSRMRQKFQEDPAKKDREGVLAPVENAAAENVPESQAQMSSE
jgi:hypothetical protein